jgi:hypothetical protein
MPKTVLEILNTPLIGGTAEHRAWIVKATDAQLDEYILCISGNQLLYPMAIAERQRRHFKHLSKPVEPHWTVLPSFKILKWTLILTIAVLIVSVAIFAVAVLSWLFPKTPPIPNDIRAISMTNSVSSPTNLPPTKAIIEQTSPAVIYTLHTNILSH